MGGGCIAFFACLTLLSTLVFVWLIVPTEQTVGADFPNVVFLTGFGSEVVNPISHDNGTMDAVTASNAKYLNGLYQFDPLFYHKSLDRFVPWEERGKAHIFACTMFCSHMNTTAVNPRLALVHTRPEEKRNLWYLLELRDEDANSPIIYARTKFRKAATYRAPWMTVTPGGLHKPHDLPDVYIFTAWDAFRFDTPVKWAATAAIIAGTVFFWKYVQDDD